MIINSKSMAVAAAALAMCMSAGSAFAQHNTGRPGNPIYEQGARGGPARGGPVVAPPRGGRDHGARGDNGHRGGRDVNRGYRGNQDFRDGRHVDRRGFPQPRTEWRRGGRVPAEYRGRNYVVNDYRAYRLQQPPRGYQWVGVGGDYVLAAIATGLIAQIIAGQ
ncbi:RcnB family protein [Variovorax boronicumulans]|uniref:RcnB family protein n=1 Tax=Variovorax boronicumulans TaxID=436515 RepID=UPI003397A83C